MEHYRIEKDSLGEIKVPEKSLYQAQTQRAIENFKISDLKLPSSFIKSLALIKQVMAEVNSELELLEEKKASAIIKATQEIIDLKHIKEFPIDVFQTGSGTSSNMNMNEVVATLATRILSQKVHPNDDVNMGQSSNDVIPSAIHISASIAIHEELLPNVDKLLNVIKEKAQSHENTVKNGRTHLMDAMPITLSQELLAWHAQLSQAKQNILAIFNNIKELALGGTAVGTGINAHPQAAKLFSKKIQNKTNIDFIASPNPFLQISSQDAAVAISGQLKVFAVALMKIANDLRWMNSGPLAGLGEIQLNAIQPGSSIMPGKINPVIPEAVAMAAAKVMGNDTAIAIAGQSGNFQLNVMLPLVAHSLLENIQLISNSCKSFMDCIEKFSVNHENLTNTVAKNPILITALNSKIGYEKGALIVKTAYQKQLPIIEVAAEMTDLTIEELKEILNPINLTK